MVDRRCPYQSDLSESENECPYQMNGIDEKWVNRVDRTIWGEMSELKEVTWNNPMGKSLWVERGEPYGSDWNEPYEKVPIKMNGIDEKWMKWSE